MDEEQKKARIKELTEIIGEHDLECHCTYCDEWRDLRYPGWRDA